MTWFGITETQTALKEEVASGSVNMAEAAADYADLYFRNAELLVSQSAQDPQLRRALQSEQPVAMELAVASLYESGRSAEPGVFERTFLLDGDGRLASVHPANASLLGADLSATDLHRAPVTLGETFVTGVLNGPLDEKAHVAIVAPVFVNGTIQGVLGGFVDVPSFGAHLQRFTHVGSEILYLAQWDGRVIYHPNGTYVPGVADFADVAPVAQGLTGRKGTAEYVNPLDGTAELAGYAPVRRLGWVVVNTVPVEAAYAGALAVTRLLLAGSVLVLGFSVAGGFYMADRVAGPVRQIQLAAEAIEGGRMDVRVPEEGGDELGALGRSFNRMAVALQASLTGIRRSEERYRGLVEHSSDLILTLRSNGEVAFVNRHATEALGRVPTEVLDRDFVGLVHPDDATDVRQAIREVVETGTPWHNVAHRVVHRDGRVRYFLTTFTPVGGMREQETRAAADDEGIRLLTVARDVTVAMQEAAAREQLFAAARLVSEETDLHALLRKGLRVLLNPLESVAGGVFLHEEAGLRLAAHQGFGDPDATPVHVRDASDEAGSGPGGVQLGRRSVRDLAALAPYRRELAEQGVEHVVVLPLRERGETLGWAFIGPAPDGDGLAEDDARLLEALAAQLAVGVRRARFEASLREYAIALEQKVEARTRELSDKNQEIEAFLYSVSHDLKAPLISIQGYLEALDEEYAEKLGEAGVFYLQRLRRNADTMERLILDLLELSRIGRVSHAMAPVPLAETVRDVLDGLRDRLDGAGATVQVDDLPTVPGQAERLRQLFANLLENAVKYRNPERSLRIRVALSAEDDDPEHVEIAVEDNGLGIPESAQDRLFQLFQRFHAHTHPEVGGTGMGLAIVKRIAETHGGGVRVESREGAGTRFLVTLRRAAEPTRPPTPDAGKTEGL